MPLVSGIELQGNRISVRCGYDGCEPRDILDAGMGLSAHQTRVAVLICDYYPYLCDSYLNRALVGLVQDALSQVQLSVVLEEIYDPSGPLPVEERCALCEEESYLLVDPGLEAKGSLLLWSFSWSSGGAFYGDSNMVLDTVLPSELMPPFVSSLKGLCGNVNVEFQELEPAEPTPEKFRKSGIREIIARTVKSFWGGGT